MTLSGVLHSKHLSHTVVCIVGSGCVWRMSHAMCMVREGLEPGRRLHNAHMHSKLMGWAKQRRPGPASGSATYLSCMLSS